MAIVKLSVNFNNVIWSVEIYSRSIIAKENFKDLYQSL